MNARLTVGAVLLGMLLLTQPAFAQEEATPPPPPPAPNAPSGPLAKPDPEGPQVHHTIWPYVLMVGGLGLVTSAIILEVSSVHQTDQADKDDQTLAQLPDGDSRKAGLQQERDDHHDSGTHERTAAIILGTAGALAIGGSVVLWFVEAGQPAPSGGSANARVRFTPSFGPGYAGAAFGGSF